MNSIDANECKFWIYLQKYIFYTHIQNVIATSFFKLHYNIKL